MKRRVLVIVLVGVATAGVWWWTKQRNRQPGPLTLFGSVDLRQVALPFPDQERIAELLVEEGDRVRAGQVLARLDTGRLMPRLARAEARAAAQAQVVRRLRRGSRPEEIAQARAGVASAQADVENAKSQHDRLLALRQASTQRAVSEKDLEAALAALRMAEARLDGSRKALDLAVAGPRSEEVAAARAELDAANAEIALLKRQLADSELRAPKDAVVRSRLMEPGEMASPQRPVVSLAVTDPKWVRAYAHETALGHLRPGMAAAASVDSFPGEAFAGWVGYISSVAEFTPKSVQTEELRPSLVYEVRVFVKDPKDRLRLGMPATVRFPEAPSRAEGRK